MTPTQLSTYLSFAFANKFPVLITGAPGIGKTDIVKEAAATAKIKLIISHPVVSDPTDYKGLPFAGSNGKADFLPFGDLYELINTTEELGFFIDDIGQAPAAVQAAIMQLLLAREINGHKISDLVTFVAATNRKQDKAGVSGILEPVKSRFNSIVELEVSADDWVRWALNNNMPIELIAFIRFKPALLNDFKASKEIVNSPSPRTVTSIGKQTNAGLLNIPGITKEMENEIYKGAAGEGFAIEYSAFLQLFRNMPNVDQIILNPTGADVPTEAGILYGLSGALAHKMNDNNLPAIVKYLERIPGEFAVSCMKDAITKKPALTNTRAFIEFASSKVGNMIL